MNSLTQVKYLMIVSFFFKKFGFSFGTIWALLSSYRFLEFGPIFHPRSSPKILSRLFKSTNKPRCNLRSPIERIFLIYSRNVFPDLNKVLYKKETFNDLPTSLPHSHQLLPKFLHRFLSNTHQWLLSSSSQRIYFFISRGSRIVVSSHSESHVQLKTWGKSGKT